MGAFSLWHWVILALILVPAWPAWRMCRRMGLPGPLGLVIVIPLANLALVWILAFIDWPIDRRAIQAAK